VTSATSGYGLPSDGSTSDRFRHPASSPSATRLVRQPRLEVGTSIVVAFARNPMNTADVVNDLNCWSGRRSSLGLGTQIKAHIAAELEPLAGEPRPTSTP
jgi:alkanesulfonate monooxygenase SsuD/methylene tetrahydromethanopterin reductase-like flavin-dependent oxidoreductase (luciferase family)